jgi:hypothetical protein
MAREIGGLQPWSCASITSFHITVGLFASSLTVASIWLASPAVGCLAWNYFPPILLSENIALEIGNGREARQSAMISAPVIPNPRNPLKSGRASSVSHFFRLCDLV